MVELVINNKIKSMKMLRGDTLLKTMFVMLTLLLSNSISSAQITKSGTTVYSFLKIGVGSRAAAMGESYIAMADDATAVYWNPAGLAQARESQALFGHIEWLADISYDNIAITAPIGNRGTVGIWANNLGVPEDIVRTVFHPEGTGERFSANMLSIGISYGQYLTDKFALGGTIKYIRESIWNMEAIGYAIDVGTLYTSNFRNMKIGIGIFNFGPKSKMSGRANLLFVDPDPNFDGNNDQIRAELEMEEWEMPLMLRAGIALDVISTEFNRLTLAVNQNYPNDNSEFFNFGSEFALNETVFLRGGYRGFGLDESEGGLSLGGGVRINLAGNTSLLVDYAYTDWGRLNEVNRFTLSANF